SVVSPPDGDMDDYMRSLRRLIDRPETIYWPGHGGPVRAPQPFVRAFLAHREAREAPILECLAPGPRTVPEVGAVMYAEVAPRRRPPPAAAAAAHLGRRWAGGRGRAGAAGGPDGGCRLGRPSSRSGAGGDGHARPPDGRDSARRMHPHAGPATPAGPLARVLV